MTSRSDRLSLIETFVRIVERGSISAAARDLGVSQASASRQLAALEASVGAPLLNRTTHSIAFTEAGRSVLATGRSLLSEWESLVEDVSEGDGALSGSLKVVAPMALGQLHLTDAVLDFQVEHPGVDITWELTDTEVRFAETGCDLWVNIGMPEDDTLIVEEAGRVERMVVASPELAAQLEAPHPDGLTALPGLALAPFEGARIPLGNGRDTALVQSDAALTTNDIFSLRRAAMRGLGYAVLPRWMVADELARGELVDMLPKWRAPELTVTCCYLPTQRLSRRLRTFRSSMVEAIVAVEGIVTVD